MRFGFFVSNINNNKKWSDASSIEQSNADVENIARGLDDRGTA
jgi:hypothetical protein